MFISPERLSLLGRLLLSTTGSNRFVQTLESEHEESSFKLHNPHTVDSCCSDSRTSSKVHVFQVFRFYLEVIDV